MTEHERARTGPTYTCADCGGVFEYPDDSEWSEQDAEKEYEESFPESEPDAREVVCDDCYRAMVNRERESIRPREPR